jgi:outer membrane protein assembly factor BamA
MRGVIFLAGARLRTVRSDFMSHMSKLLPLLLAATMPAAAQYTAKKIVFNHPGAYTQAQLEAAAGMHAGMAFHAADLGDAAQRLIDTGYFDNVGATLEGMTNAASVLFDIKPTDHAQMLHVGFENFVWLTQAEIEDAIRAKSPLFVGYLPESSPLDDVVTATLTDMLSAKGITAKVTHDTVEPTMLQPERVLEFRVANPATRVTGLKLAGVAQELAPLIQKSVNATAGTAYNEGLAGQSTQDRILAPLLDAGYVQASLADITRTPSAVSDTGVTVALSATLNAGDVFHVSGVHFAGTSLLSAEEFAGTEKLHAGDIASRQALMETLAPLDAAYRRQGYMDVVIHTSPVPNAATHQVAYTVTVDPGEQYRMHEITANNLDPEAQKDFDRGFLMKAGELYNPEYVATFLKRNTALLALAGYSASFKAYADPNTHTVDLVINFVRGGVR